MNARRPTAKHLTVRNLPGNVARGLERERKRRSKSLNQTAIELLGRALGVGPGGPRTNGLEKLAGGWSDADLQTFETSQAGFEEVDEELWK
jgi:hypothetical protein